MVGNLTSSKYEGGFREMNLLEPCQNKKPLLLGSFSLPWDLRLRNHTIDLKREMDAQNDLGEIKIKAGALTIKLSYDIKDQSKM